MDRSPLLLAIIVPVGILAIGFMVYTLSFFRQQHIVMLLTMLSDVAFLTILFHTLSGLLFVPAERSALLGAGSSRKRLVIAACLLPLLGLSVFLHASGALPLLNRPVYASVAVIPLLLVAFNRLF